MSRSRSLPRRTGVWRAVAVSLVALLAAHPAEAKPAKRKPKKPRTAQDADWSAAPSVKYAGMTRKECLAELKHRKVKFEEIEQARGVMIPIRPKGAIGGVVFRTEAPAAERATSPHEVMDCRLALALTDLAAILVKYDIEEVLHFSAWRPPEKSWPADKPAIRHPGGLAIDLRRFVKKTAPGAKPKDLIVERDWKPARDKPPCTAEAKASGDAEAKELRAIFCEADEQRIFTSQLSPNYDKAHENHFHFEIRPDVKWRLVL